MPINIPQNPNGQALMANSLPVVIASNQTAIPVANSSDITASGSLTALNSTVVSISGGSGTVMMQIGGTWVGTITFEGSNDAFSTSQAITAIYLGGTQTQAATATINGFFSVISAGFAQVRAKMTAYTSGTATILVNNSSASRIVVPLQGNPNNNQALVTQGAAATTPWPTIASSSTTALAAGIKATYTAYGYTRVTAEPKVEFADAFDGVTVDVTNRWTQLGTVTQANSAVAIGNVLTTSTVNSLTSQPTFNVLGLSFQVLAFVMSTEASPLSTTNVNRFRGFGTHTSTPSLSVPVTDGVGFEWDAATAKLYGAIWQSGVRSASSIDLTAYVTSSNTRYAILYRSDLAIFYIGSTEIPVGSISFVTPNTQNLPIKLQTVIGASAPSTTPLDTTSAVAVGDTGGNTTQLTDGTFPWRKATVSNAGALLVSSLGIPAALGQTTMSASQPVVIASNQTNIPTVLMASSTTAAVIRPDNYLKVAGDSTSLFYDSFDSSLDTTTRWTAGGTSPTVTTGVLSVNAGTTALAVSSLTTQPTFALLGNMFSNAFAVMAIDTSALTGNYRFFGFGIAAGSPTVAAPIVNGVGFEFIDTTGAMSGVVWSNGVKTQTLALTRPTDGLNHRYGVYYKTSRVYFEVDNVSVGSIATPNPNTSTLPVLALSVNGAATVSPSATLTFTFIGCGDTARNNQMLSDGAFPWRKASISAVGALSVSDSRLPTTLGNQTASASLATTISTETASGSITTQNLVPAGVATAGSAVEITLNGNSGIGSQVTGTYTGALSLQVTIDGTNWITVGGSPFFNKLTAGNLATITSALQSILTAEVATCVKARITALAAVTGTAVVTIKTTSSNALVGINNALPTGGNSIGNITTLANGQTTHSSASTGSPLRIGGRVITTLDTTLVQGDASDLAVTSGQQLVIKDFASSENDWQFVGTITTTTQTAIKTAGAASIRNFVTCITYQNTNATATTLNIQDGSVNILSISCAASMLNPVNLTFSTPLKGSAATAINYTAGTNASNVLLNVQGFQSF